MEDLWTALGDGSRDPRLGWFACGGKLDGVLPSGQVLGILECLALPYGPDDVPFAGATHDEEAGMLAAAAAAESRAAAVKLAVVRRLIRRHAPAVPDGGLPGRESWDVGLFHEVAAVLRISWQAASPVADLAWELEARLPGVGELLDCGVLTALTARIITEEFSVLEGDRLAEAEKRLLDHDLAGDDMTPGAIRRLCQRIADTADPQGAAKRREQKERDEARVRFYRSHGGTGALFAAGLPPDAALMSEANIQKRALEYRNAGIREKMDCLRVLALVDLTNGTGVPGRLALWRAAQAEKQRSGGEDPGRRAWDDEQRENAARLRYGDRPPFPDREPGDLDDRDPGEPRHPDNPDQDQDAPPFPDTEPDGLDDRYGDGCDGEPPQDPENPPVPGPGDGHGDGPGGNGGPGASGGNGPGGAGGGPVPAGIPDPGLPTLANMTYPLATVLGQADRPGEAAGYGSLDPALVRTLAAAAAASPRSEFCVTFTDEQGHAVAHGCARLIRKTGNTPRNGHPGEGTGPPGGTRDGPPGTGWAFARDPASPGPDGGYGTWILTLPGGHRYRVGMHKIPLHDCDHSYAAGAYRPGDLLRHLVQVRDGECTFTGCSRPARESDFEHAVPYHKGGATDACNAGMRSRRCHQVKQSPGWNVTQPEPGWHKWTAPSGRSYTKGPKDYPA